MMMIMNPWRIHKCQANCLLSSLLGICTPGTFSGFLWVNKLQAMLGMEIGITFIPNQRTTLQGNTFKWEGEHDMFNISLNRYCLEVSSNQLLFDLQIFQRHDRSAPKEFPFLLSVGLCRQLTCVLPFTLELASCITASPLHTSVNNVHWTSPLHAITNLPYIAGWCD